MKQQNRRRKTDVVPLETKLRNMNTEERQWITGHGNMSIVGRACDAFLEERNMRGKNWRQPREFA